MNAYITRALALGLALLLSAPLAADDGTETPTELDPVEVLLVNQHDVDVRVYAERADGRLFILDRVRRGEAKTLAVPEALASEEYRLKVVRAPVDIWDYEKDLEAIKTMPLRSVDTARIVVWLEDELPESRVEVTER